MNSDLQQLIRLQQLDLDIESARRRIAEIPSVQNALDARLAEHQATVAALKQRLAENQTGRRATEAEVASLQTRLSKYKGQLMEVKTNKEYQAMQKEIATAEEAVRSLEDRILEHMEEAETLGRELKVTETALKAQQDDIARERKRLEEEAGALAAAHERDHLDAGGAGQGALASRAATVRARFATAQGARRRRSA